MNRSVSWPRRVGGLLAALLVYAGWQSLDARLELGTLSTVLRIVVVIGIVAWAWRAPASRESASAPEKSTRGGAHAASGEPHHTPQTEISQLPDDPFWAMALEELNSGSREAALWERCLADAKGNRSLAEMQYLRDRSQQLAREKGEQDRRTAKAAQDAQLDSALRLVEALPKGKCPTCQAVLLLSAQQCPKCGTSFLPGSGHKVLPLKGV